MIINYLLVRPIELIISWLGILQLGFFALYIFTYKDFKQAEVKDYNK